jgi:hypothetical protein
MRPTSQTENQAGPTASRPERRLSHLLAAGCALGLLLTGCGRLNEKPPQAVDLSGDWQLRRSLSDDPVALLKRHRRGKRRDEDRPGDVEATSGDSKPDDDGEGQRESRGAGAQDAGQFAAGRPDRDGPDFAMLRNLLAQPVDLSIRQSPKAVILTADGSPTRYVYGQDAIDSVQDGVAERTAGWDGDAFVIKYDVRQGPDAIRSYRKDPDGQWLTVTTRVRGGGAPKLEIRSVYERKAPG